jgi:hypothetical protein
MPAEDGDRARPAARLSPALATRGLLIAAMVLIAGVAIELRLEEFGRFGFWTDEAWVALSTRVSASQYWLAVSITPVLWAVLLKAISVLPGPPELVLRLLPLAGSLLTVWGAGRLATNLGGPAAGLLAAAVVAVDPLAVQYAKLLKPYSVESGAALTALAVASRFLRTRASRDLWILTFVLVVGVGFSSAQLLVGLPILTALLFDGLLRRDRSGARAVAVALLAVGTWYLGWYWFLMAPRMGQALAEYWRASFMPTTSLSAAVRFAWQSLARELASTWPAWTGLPAVAGALALCAALPVPRVIALALVLLVLELAALSAAGRFPFAEPRVMLFCTLALSVFGAAGVGFVLARLAERPRLRPVALALASLLVVGFVRDPRWPTLGNPKDIEDTGRLIRQVEARRGPDDGVLVFGRSTYLYAYYQRATPVLLPAGTTVGFVPVFDARVAVVMGANFDPAATRLLDESREVCFVGSRLTQRERSAIEARITGAGRVVFRENAPNAVALCIAREPVSPGGALERRHALRHVVERLLVDGEDHHLRSLEDARVVEGTDLDDQGAGHCRGLRQDVGPALGAELARDRVGQVAAAELLR